MTPFNANHLNKIVKCLKTGKLPSERNYLLHLIWTAEEQKDAKGGSFLIRHGAHLIYA